MTITTEAFFSGPHLPTTVDLTEAIRDLPGFKEWWMADPEMATLSPSGGIMALTGMAGNVLADGPYAGSVRAPMTARLLGPYSGADFSKQSRLVAPNSVVNLAAAFSFALIVKAKPDLGANTFTSLLSWFAHPGNQIQVTKNGGSETILFNFVSGSKTMFVPDVIPTDGKWHVLIGSIDIAAGTMRISVDGAPPRTVTVAGPIDAPTGTLAVGGLAGDGFADWRSAMQLADLILFEAEIVATQAYRDLLMQYAEMNYGL